jgi:hypothetical protein
MSKHHFFLIYCIIALVVTACSGEGRPANVLDQEKMVPVLADLEIVYAGIDQTVQDPKNRVAKYEEMNGLVLKKHNIDQEQFYLSYQWYEANPSLLDTIFKQVASKLNDDLNALQAGESGKPRGKVPELN